MKRIFTSLLILSLTGCATSIPMSPENKNQIHKISVNKKVSLPKEMVYYGPEQLKAQSYGGLIGIALVSSSARENQDFIEKTMANSHVNIKDIVLNDFSQKIAAKNTLKIVTDSKPDAELIVTITNYGFLAKPYITSSKYTPGLDVKAELIKDNKVVWAKSASAAGFTQGLPAYTLEEIHHDPARIKEMLVAASNKLTTEILQSL